MKSCIIFVVCVLIFPISSTIAAATRNGAKSYRNDYVYDQHTDAFYKLHVDSESKLQRKEMCELEGAKLVSLMSEHDVPPTRPDTELYQTLTEQGSDWQHHVAPEDQPIIYNAEDKNAYELSCRVRTQSGYLPNLFPGKLFFICKIDAKDVHYDSICGVPTKGYRFIPSVSSCYKIPRVAYTWDQASAECQAEGAHLAVINSVQEARELKYLTYSVEDMPESRDMPYFHIGFRAVKVTAPRVFKTIFNETLEEAGFSRWARGEPTNADGNESCGSLFRTEGKLNDLKCFARYAFICEKEVTSTSSDEEARI